MVHSIKEFLLKLWKTSLRVVPFVLLLLWAYNFFNKVFIKILGGEEPVKQALALVTFIGGLMGGVLLESLKKIWWKPSLAITGWLQDKNNSLMRNTLEGNIDFRIRIKNTSSVIAENCEIKLTIEYEKNDIEECGFSSEDCSTYLKTDVPFIRNENEFMEIVDENILWDLQYKGERPLKINIQPGISYLATIARYKVKGMYFEVPSENYIKPRTWLKVINNNGAQEFKKYKVKITLCGDNFLPVVKDEYLQLGADIYDPIHHLNLHQLQLQIEVARRAFGHN